MYLKNSILELSVLQRREHVWVDSLKGHYYKCSIKLQYTQHGWHCSVNLSSCFPRNQPTTEDDDEESEEEKEDNVAESSSEEEQMDIWTEG